MKRKIAEVRSIDYNAPECRVVNNFDRRLLLVYLTGGQTPANAPPANDFVNHHWKTPCHGPKRFLECLGLIERHAAFGRDDGQA